ncbi:2Fe-2S iron-sulfur cluster-binding protein [Zavarzinia compransoris]|uniref:2Fe-2S iron-sulfur cluster-binding protein n=1 Tax=Zavarzinia marina TaxID=2911065 RepID=UPI001F342822|nr:2Fe-2S iron-sulfur cluster-binding protein [Zavarzinia marina]MCF4167006.1 2Fe-2S iron-sulfur cluster-binding protein [Zavarzinia marina]
MVTAAKEDPRDDESQVKITFILNDGSRRCVSSPPCKSLMQVAVSNGIPGIEGDCGGNCVCGTCLVVQLSEGQLPPAKVVETEMLNFLANDDPATRLACQIPVDERLDGIVVRVVGLV